MMAVDMKRLSDPVPIDTSRAEAAGDRQIAANRLRAKLLDAALSCPERVWLALIVANHAEILVENMLIETGLSAWSPCRQVENKRRVGRYGAARKVHMEPAFPGYVFAELPAKNEMLAWLRGVDGVRGLICGSAGRPVVIRAEELNRVRDLVSCGWLDQTVEAKRRRAASMSIAPGETVAIEDGPMRGLTGVLDGYVGSRHVRVLMWLFGGQSIVKVDLAQIGRAE